MIDYADTYHVVSKQNKTKQNDRNEIWKGWEDHLGSMCEEVEACAGATQLVEELAKTGIPMAIATSSRYAGVEQKRKR